MRLKDWTSADVQNENTRQVRMVFRRQDFVDSNLLAVEVSGYFRAGCSPIHAEAGTEEIIYFTRGRGRVLQGEDYRPVSAGDAVAIVPGIRHQVVNDGPDYLEHILVCSAVDSDRHIGPSSSDGLTSHEPGGVDPTAVVLDDPELRRLRFRRLDLAKDARTNASSFPDAEVVYAVTAGAVVFEVSARDGSYTWEFSAGSREVMWLPPSYPHSIRNVGDGEARIATFLCHRG